MTASSKYSTLVPSDTELSLKKFSEIALFFFPPKMNHVINLKFLLDSHFSRKDRKNCIHKINNVIIPYGKFHEVSL